MFHEMRRKDRQLEEKDCELLLENEEYGILSTIGEDGYPYGVPVNYCYVDGAVCFHGTAENSHRMDNFKFSDKACFTIVGKTQPLPEKFSTLYESVIAFGTLSVIEDDEEKVKVLKKLIDKYSADFTETGYKYAMGSQGKTRIFKMKIEHMTGKARRS